MEAVLLAGGRGSRLRPLTVTTPKTMLPMAGVPFLTHHLARLAANGVEHVVITTSEHGSVVADHFGDGSALGMHLDYCVETEPLGTGGALRNSSAFLRAAADEPVLVLNAGVLTEIDLAGLVARHLETEADITITLTRVSNPTAYGLVTSAPDGHVLGFREKPSTSQEIVTNQINAGCYAFRRAVIDAIPVGRPVSIEREIIPDLLGRRGTVGSLMADCYWLDMGTPAGFVRGARDLVMGRAPSPVVTAPGPVMLLPGAVVAATAVVDGGSCVGAGAVVGAGARVQGSVLMDGATVAEGAVVKDSVVGVGATVGARATLQGVLVGDGAVVGAGCELRDGMRVFPGVVLADSGLRFSSDR